MLNITWRFEKRIIDYIVKFDIWKLLLTINHNTL